MGLKGLKLELKVSGGVSSIVRHRILNHKVKGLKL